MLIEAKNSAYMQLLDKIASLESLRKEKEMLMDQLNASQRESIMLTAKLETWE
jgi:hypothetical protein